MMIDQCFLTGFLPLLPPRSLWCFYDFHVLLCQPCNRQSKTKHQCGRYLRYMLAENGRGGQLFKGVGKAAVVQLVGEFLNVPATLLCDVNGESHHGFPTCIVYSCSWWCATG